VGASAADGSGAGGSAADGFAADASGGSGADRRAGASLGAFDQGPRAIMPLISLLAWPEYG
jgi:hypothetical protein